MSITLLTLRDRIRSVLDRWDEQYRDWPDDRLFHDGRRPGDVRQSLAALDLATCSEADVAAAVGNHGWVSLECEECGEDYDTLCRIGDEPDYEARWLDLCGSCLGKAMRLLSSAA